jgi:hypothetical protein
MKFLTIILAMAWWVNAAAFAAWHLNHDLSSIFNANWTSRSY